MFDWRLLSRLGLLAGLAASPALAAPLRMTGSNAPATRGAAALPGGGFCLQIATQLAICNYADQATCTRDAGLDDGTCLPAPAVPRVKNAQSR